MEKVALITGGTRGIGFGIAKEMAKAGYQLIINGVRDGSMIASQISDLKLYSSKVFYFQGDISLADSREKLLVEAKRRFGKVDVLINNAGIAPKERRDILSSTIESFQEVIKVNLEGPYFLTQLVANWMIQLKDSQVSYSPYIINISSISATLASTNRGEYCISKAGISMMTKLFAIRLGEFNIPVFEIRPGITRTDMTKGVEEKYDKMIGDGLCVQRRWGLPKDVGKAVISLVSGSYDYSTGQVIMVDGGISISRL